MVQSAESAGVTALLMMRAEDDSITTPPNARLYSKATPSAFQLTQHSPNKLLPVIEYTPYNFTITYYRSNCGWFWSHWFASVGSDKPGGTDLKKCCCSKSNNHHRHISLHYGYLILMTNSMGRAIFPWIWMLTHPPLSGVHTMFWHTLWMVLQTPLSL